MSSIPNRRLPQNCLWVEGLLVVALIVLGAKVLGAEVRSEFIFEKAPFEECHASTIVETAAGDLLAAWFGGEREGAKDVAIWMSRFSENRWSAPEVVAREPGVPTWNPVLFRGHDNRIWLFYKFGPSPQTWTGAYRISDDDGTSWSAPVYLPAGLLGPSRTSLFGWRTEKSSPEAPWRATEAGRVGWSAPPTTAGRGRSTVPS